MELHNFYPIIKNKVDDVLRNNGNSLDYHLQDLNQITKIQARINENKKYTNQECLEGFTLSIFSAVTDWSNVRDNLQLLRRHVFNVDISKLAKYTKHEIDDIASILVEAGLKKNINKNLTFIFDFCQNISDKNYKSDGTDLFDSYANLYGKGTLDDKYKLLSEIMKFKGMGVALSAEFMKNIGFDIAKPDTHIMRLLSTNRLNIGSWDKIKPNQDYKDKDKFQAIKIFFDAAVKLNIFETEIDNVLWLYCAKSYCNICRESPKCNQCVCELKKICKHFQSNKKNKKNKDNENEVKNISNIYASITSSTKRSGVLIYNRLKIYKKYQNLFIPGKTYSVYFKNNKIFEGQFSYNYFEMDNDFFSKLSNNQSSDVIIEREPLNNYNLKILSITKRKKS